MKIIEALECRDAELAERLAREHALGLATHVEEHGDFLDISADEGGLTSQKAVTPLESGSPGARDGGLAPGSPLARE